MKKLFAILALLSGPLLADDKIEYTVYKGKDANVSVYDRTYRQVTVVEFTPKSDEGVICVLTVGTGHISCVQKTDRPKAETIKYLNGGTW